MAMAEKTYIAIDLKTFYASVECVQRGYDPMKTNLVVADKSRTDKTICLAVSPSLKAYGISGRARLFEVVQEVDRINAKRKAHAPGRVLDGSSIDEDELRAHPELAVDFVIAMPQMQKYMEWSARIYEIYLRHVAESDIHPYSIDEVFIDATDYLSGRTPYDFAREILREVLAETGIPATAGIGTNLYLCKVALDITAKHIPADRDGVRVASLDERSYREKLWPHRPITDFWRVGGGYSRRLESMGLYTMGDVARVSLTQPGRDLLYRAFGVNAELLIDHAWGWEPVTMADIKNYRAGSKSLSSGQVLMEPYPFEKARLVTREMADSLSMDLVAKRLVTDQIVLTIGYDRSSLSDPQAARAYRGEVTSDHYGRQIPKHAHGTRNLGRQTSSTRLITEAAMELYDRIVDPELQVRRITIVAARVIPEDEAERDCCEQLDLFGESDAREKEEQELARERRRQEAILSIQRRYGKNAVLKGMDLEEGATAIQRNEQIGGHRK